MTALRILGRSSSHNTRCARMLAHELGLAHEFAPIPDLLSQRTVDFAGNPALRLPILVTEQGAWYGTLSMCRELARIARRERDVVWPEELTERIAANAQELVLQGMATEVSLIMGALGDANPGPYAAKNRVSLGNSLAWLEANVPQVVRELRQDRALSFLELTLFCFVTHLGFREVFDATSFHELQAFCAAYGKRASARSTEYRFDSV